jgi:hypothetical protein
MPIASRPLTLSSSLNRLSIIAADLILTPVSDKLSTNTVNNS